MDDRKDNCKLCRWWYLGLGQCRKDAPYLGDESPGGAKWPQTLGSDWCGDFERLPKPLTEE